MAPPHLPEGMKRQQIKIWKTYNLTTCTPVRIYPIAGRHHWGHRQLAPRLLRGKYCLYCHNTSDLVIRSTQRTCLSHTNSLSIIISIYKFPEDPRQSLFAMWQGKEVVQCYSLVWKYYRTQRFYFWEEGSGRFTIRGRDQKLPIEFNWLLVDYKSVVLYTNEIPTPVNRLNPVFHVFFPSQIIRTSSTERFPL